MTVGTSVSCSTDSDMNTTDAATTTDGTETSCHSHHVDGFFYSLNLRVTENDNDGVPQLNLYNEHAENAYGKVKNSFTKTQGL